MAVATDPHSAHIQARKQLAGRVGFAMGCVAAVVAAVINFARAPRPLSPGILLLIVLMAAMNIPFGIALGLLGERVTRNVRRGA
jgi:Kef-type K+ transport system membrane component KefB